MIVKKGNIFKNKHLIGFVPADSLWELVFVAKNKSIFEYVLVSINQHRDSYISFTGKSGLTLEESLDEFNSMFDLALERTKGQSRWGSFLEAKLNTAVGFIISLLTWKYIVPIIWPEMEPYTGLNHTIGITLLFTGISIGRNYFTRRFMEWRTHRRLK